MPRVAIPTYFFVLVVVEHDGRFLFVQEAKHGQVWYLPAGGVEPGETFEQAAVRETLEEAGVRVQPLGVVGVDERWFPSESGALHGKVRVVMRARVVGSPEPKSFADEHSLGARWLARDELASYRWRDAEIYKWIDEASALSSRRAGGT